MPKLFSCRPFYPLHVVATDDSLPLFAKRCHNIFSPGFAFGKIGMVVGHAGITFFAGFEGDLANIGVIARKKEYWPYIAHDLSCARIATCFAYFLEGSVECFYLPGCHAINYLLYDVLGGGGIASLRSNPQGKGYAQILLEQTVRVPLQLL